MFRQKTSIVIGAGASCEIRLPFGDLFAGCNDNSYELKNPRC